jgi:YjbE family integral membrane protein
MKEVQTMEFFVALTKIMMVNIVLSGDNAVVIALASRCLPPKQQKMAILWGSAGAIGLRVVLTLAAVVLLKIPYLQLIGGLLLIWIAAKLLMENDECENIEASSALWPAIKTIIIADIVMSLDNTLAIAAVANGDYVLLAVGLALSIPLIIFGSQIIIKLMDRFPVIVYIGSGLIAAPYLHYLPGFLLPALITGGVIAAGIWHNKYRKAPAQEPVETTEVAGQSTD